VTPREHARALCDAIVSRTDYRGAETVAEFREEEGIIDAAEALVREAAAPLVAALREVLRVTDHGSPLPGTVCPQCDAKDMAQAILAAWESDG
jgi:hypothetical protein